MDVLKRYWRDFAERARFEPEQGEFLPGVDQAPDPVARREFLTLMGASIALAGLDGCSSRPPSGEIVPYVIQPPEVTPGIPSDYASAFTRDGYGVGVIVQSHEGRPTKVEGNPDHPASLGASGVFEQAAILGLYDPDRARGMRRGALPSLWAALVDELTRAHGEGRGRGLHLLLEPTSSPLVEFQLGRVRQRFPEALVHFYAPLAPTAAWEGAQLALGRPLETQLDLKEADVILALDADFLGEGPAHLSLSRDFADRRRVQSAADSMNRLYVAESALSITGMAADHRLRLRTREVAALTGAIVAAAGVSELGGLVDRWRTLGDPMRRWVDAVSRDLLAHRGRSAVLIGDAQPAAVHAMGHALNAALGNVGRTVRYTESPILEAGRPSHGLALLVGALGRGEVETLLILGQNPVYTAPANFELAAQIARAGRSVYLGLYENETAHACTWFVPAAHELEAWGDTRAKDGTTSLVQPLISPLHDGRTPSQLLAVLTGELDNDARGLLRDFWEKQRPGDIEAFFTAALARGAVPGSALPVIDAKVSWVALRASLGAFELAPPDASLEVTFFRDSRVYDGRFTNNAWLLELPDPITKLTWGNAAQISATTAARLGVETGDMVELRLEGRSVEVPILVAAGQADDALALHLGYGRKGSEKLARDLGANAYRLRTSAAPFFATGVTLTKLGRHRRLPITQLHHALEGRDDSILRHSTLETYRAEPAHGEDKQHRPLGLYQLRPTAAHQWGMVIDLGACTGCNACVVACQAENNIPVVGEKGVLKGREMHWLRIDRYFEGEPDNPQVLLEPMLCQHCEMAPCEYVCPVNATSHSDDGLNQMTYNRCVGTRFCSNNCPYKVRRFNWFDYHADMSKTEALAMNPDVTVRARGVMEKCTFCVQRIRGGEIRARVEGRKLDEGELQTACQQACPSRAIVFGNINDPSSEVAKHRTNDRIFSVLGELGTNPRVRYLAKLTNPNPELA